MLGSREGVSEKREPSGDLVRTDRLGEEDEVPPPERRVRGGADDDVPFPVLDLAPAEREHGVEVRPETEGDDVQCREEDSNLRRLSQRVYSPPPLATRESLRGTRL